MEKCRLDKVSVIIEGIQSKRTNKKVYHFVSGE